MIRKILSTQFAKSAKGFTATITTDTVDRDREVLVPQGCNVKEWEVNPVLLWMHDPHQPIGMGSNVRRRERSIEADFTFAARPKDYEGEWFPDYARGLVEAGVVRAVSVGADYLAGGYRQATARDREMYGMECERVVSKWKLFEVSLVSIPANPDALLSAVRKGYVTRAAVKQFDKIDVPAEAAPIVVEKRVAPHVIRVDVPRVGPDMVSEIVSKEIARLRGRVWY
jgi:HK97 family phage prohead protease